MNQPRYAPVRAPDFRDGLAWLNTPRPLRLADLRGKFVLLDFWTFCCINCMHVLPDLKRLERAYPDELVVIGVHSAKFEHERQTESIRNAILRHQIEHPVVNDHAFAVWRQYAVRAWPTLFLIDPKGYIVGKRSGEGVFAPLDQALRQLIPVFDAEGTLDRTPLPAVLERERAPRRMLSFPGKIAGDAASRRLFISDSNHHRLLVTDFDGRVLETVGSGEAGLRDGAFEEAAFRQPQGVCFDAETETLFVADTENHALRRVDLRARRVETLAGSGAQAPYGTHRADGPGTPLNSPWDVLLHEGRLYVAMAGPHQLWVFDPATGGGAVYAGDGRENIVDGPRLEAELAQPSGLATDGAFLYFADSETSALRRVPFGGEDAAVETLVGRGLFEFGDVDGRYPDARLQHPLGLACADGVVYVADSYNHKVRRYFVEERALTGFLGTGAQGYADGGPNAAQFNEPGGLAVIDGVVYVADTNNHQIRLADLATGTVRTLPIAETLADDAPAAEVLPAQTVAPGEGALTLHVTLPDGYHSNDLHPGALTVASADARVARPGGSGALPVAYPTTLPFTFAAGATELRVEGTLYYCDDSDGRCLLEPVNLRIPVEVRADAPSSAVAVSMRVAAPVEA